MDNRRPSIAFVSNGVTPYGINLLRRIAREMPEIRLWTLYTHQSSMAPWRIEPPAEINPVAFGFGEHSGWQGSPRLAIHEWRKGGRIISWMREHDIRAVISLGYNGPARVRIFRWCQSNSIPWLLSGDSNIRCDAVSGLKAVIKTHLVRWVVRNASAILPCGQRGEAYFAKYGAIPDRVFVFPTVPDFDEIHAVSPAAIAAARARYGLPVGRRRLAFSGRLVPVKRVDLLMDAFVAIADRRPDWDLLIIGDGPLRRDLEARIPVRLRPRVTWTGFVDDQAAISTLYRTCDALVLPSDWEPWAVVLLEAAAAGLAVVSSDIPGAAPEVIREGVNGCTFPAGDFYALARCLLDVTDATRTDKMKAASIPVLDDWRKRTDPIEALRKALEHAGSLPQSEHPM